MKMFNKKWFHEMEKPFPPARIKPSIKPLFPLGLKSNPFSLVGMAVFCKNIVSAIFKNLFLLPGSRFSVFSKGYY